MATNNSNHAVAPPAPSTSLGGFIRGSSEARRRTCSPCWVWVLTLFLAEPPLAFCQEEEGSPQNAPRVHAQRVYEEAKKEYVKNSTQARAAWEFGRACYGLAEFAPDNSRRESLALEGIEACRLSLQRHPRIAPAHYYLALNLGQQARTKSLGALSLVEEMEGQFLRSIELDAKFDYAGAHRAIGYLYRDAPGWPVSVGNKSKSRSHFRKALALFPDYPGNQLAWIESLVKWGEKDEAKEGMGAAQKTLESARQKLVGERWASSWLEWDAKWQWITDELKPEGDSD